MPVQGNGQQYRNPSGRHNDTSLWHRAPRRDWAEDQGRFRLRAVPLHAGRRLVEATALRSRQRRHVTAAPKQGRISDPIVPLLSRYFCAARWSAWLKSRFQAISEPAQIGIVRLRIICWFGGDELLFLASQCRSQLRRRWPWRLHFRPRRMSVSLRSNVSAHTWESLAALIS